MAHEGRLIEIDDAPQRNVDAPQRNVDAPQRNEIAAPVNVLPVEAPNVDVAAALTVTPLPAYVYDSAEWFLQVESIFHMLRVTSQPRKFASVMQKLPPDIVGKVSDILSDIPRTNPYDRLKEAIIKRTGRSEEERIENVLRNVTRGDRSPSELLQYMKTQLGSQNVSDKVLRSMWMERLPKSVTQIIAPMMRTAALEDLAESADLVFSRLDHSIHAIKTPEPVPQSSLERALADLQQQVNDLRIALQRQDRSRTPARRDSNRTQSRSRDRSTLNGLCYYHRRFGDKAKKCTSTCTHKAQEN